VADVMIEAAPDIAGMALALLPTHGAGKPVWRALGAAWLCNLNARRMDDE